ncbi:hypothetical protein E2C01_031226 [Portunus trituberculatus]|uniref:Uncharacterized protein n=1 Tax=Portunus trituberculatus TaxID=210409 RepID=A0A5B7EX25_PORTR|nr:hypothetical protein [Portunus trituberculatus]
MTKFLSVRHGMGRDRAVGSERKEGEGNWRSKGVYWESRHGQTSRLGTACNYEDNRLQAGSGTGGAHLHPGSHTTSLSHGPATRPLNRQNVEGRWQDVTYRTLLPCNPSHVLWCPF